MDSRVKVVKSWLDQGVRSDEELLNYYREAFPMEREELEEKAYYSQLRPLIGQLKSEMIDTGGNARLVRDYWHDSRIKGYVPVDEVDEELIRIQIWEAEKKASRHANEAEAGKQLFFQNFGLETEAGPLVSFDSNVEKLFYPMLLERVPAITRGENGYKLGRYRYDFAWESEKVLIEIDGQDHHASQEDREKDCKKARFAQKKGWSLIRFTAKEIFQRPAKCIDEVLQIRKTLKMAV